MGGGYGTKVVEKHPKPLNFAFWVVSEKKKILKKIFLTEKIDIAIFLYLKKFDLEIFSKKIFFSKVVEEHPKPIKIVFILITDEKKIFF